jgi:hypothetical protein
VNGLRTAATAPPTTSLIFCAASETSERADVFDVARPDFLVAFLGAGAVSRPAEEVVLATFLLAVFETPLLDFRPAAFFAGVFFAFLTEGGFEVCPLFFDAGFLSAAFPLADAPAFLTTRFFGAGRLTALAARFFAAPLRVAARALPAFFLVAFLLSALRLPTAFFLAVATTDSFVQQTG